MVAITLGFVIGASFAVWDSRSLYYDSGPAATAGLVQNSDSNA